MYSLCIYTYKKTWCVLNWVKWNYTTYCYKCTCNSFLTHCYSWSIHLTVGDEKRIDYLLTHLSIHIFIIMPDAECHTCIHRIPIRFDEEIQSLNYISLPKVQSRKTLHERIVCFLIDQTSFASIFRKHLYRVHLKLHSLCT